MSYEEIQSLAYDWTKIGINELRKIMLKMSDEDLDCFLHCIWEDGYDNG